MTIYVHRKSGGRAIFEDGTVIRFGVPDPPVRRTAGISISQMSSLLRERESGGEPGESWARWFATPCPENINSEAPAFQPPHLQSTKSCQVPPLPTDIHHPHRSGTYSANISACSSSSPSTPHLSTAQQQLDLLHNQPMPRGQYHISKR